MSLRRNHCAHPILLNEIFGGHVYNCGSQNIWHFHVVAVSEERQIGKMCERCVFFIIFCVQPGSGGYEQSHFHLRASPGGAAPPCAEPFGHGDAVDNLSGVSFGSPRWGKISISFLVPPTMVDGSNLASGGHEPSLGNKVRLSLLYKKNFFFKNLERTNV